MKRHLHESRYGQRWQVETVYSMIKRLSGEVVNARTYWRRCRLLLLKVLTHNITILKRQIGFLLSRSVPIFAASGGAAVATPSKTGTDPLTLLAPRQTTLLGQTLSLFGAVTSLACIATHFATNRAAVSTHQLRHFRVRLSPLLQPV